MRALLCAALTIAAGVAAAGPPEVQVELNKLEAIDSDCRVYLVFTNGLAERLRSLKLDLVLFDRESVIARRVAVEGGPLAAGKTVIKAFDLQDVSCGDLGRVLLNDVAACEGDGGARSGCIEAVSTTSRAEIEFIK